jgi:hypothetical protein
MTDESIFDEIAAHGVLGIAIAAVVVFFLLPAKYPKGAILLVPAVAFLFVVANVPAWIIIGWILSASVWFTIPIWVPLSNGEAPFSQPD